MLESYAYKSLPFYGLWKERIWDNHFDFFTDLADIIDRVTSNHSNKVSFTMAHFLHDVLQNGKPHTCMCIGGTLEVLIGKHVSQVVIGQRPQTETMQQILEQCGFVTQGYLIASRIILPIRPDYWRCSKEQASEFLRILAFAERDTLSPDFVTATWQSTLVVDHSIAQEDRFK